MFSSCWRIQIAITFGSTFFPLLKCCVISVICLFERMFVPCTLSYSSEFVFLWICECCLHLWMVRLHECQSFDTTDSLRSNLLPVLLVQRKLNPKVSCAPRALCVCVVKIWKQSKSDYNNIPSLTDHRRLVIPFMKTTGQQSLPYRLSVIKTTLIWWSCKFDRRPWVFSA